MNNGFDDEGLDLILYSIILIGLLMFSFFEVYLTDSNYIVIFVIIWICLGISIREDG